MKCEYDDGYKVDYSGSLRITKDEDVNLYVKKRSIPTAVCLHCKRQHGIITVLS